MRLTYTLIIHIYTFAIRLASFISTKAKQWVKGRENEWDNIQKKLDLIGTKNHKTIWVHCASLGEFEQGRPLIERLKNKSPETKIILTFFSPSGYEVRKDYPYADLIFYLPIDTPSNAKKFISLINPEAVFFVKYEFWFNYLKELKKNNIPTYLVSGIFRPDHYFFKWYGAWGRKQLNCFTHFFVQNAESALLLESIGYKNASIAGDTRFDRVFDICKNAKQYNLIDIFKGDRKILIAGSTWLNDEQLLSTLNTTTLNIKLIIAPHEVNQAHIQSLETLFSKNQNIDLLRFSKANEHNIKSANVLIIDSIGLLSSLYQYGTIAYIGGGFGKGIHNILEAATFGLPVIFGPHYKKFAEAVELINQQGAFSINDANSLNKQLTFLLNENKYSAASSICKKYVEANTGATDRILTKISMVTYCLTTIPAPD